MSIFKTFPNLTSWRSYHNWLASVKFGQLPSKFCKISIRDTSLKGHLHLCLGNIANERSYRDLYLGCVSSIRAFTHCSSIKSSSKMDNWTWRGVVCWSIDSPGPVGSIGWTWLRQLAVKNIDTWTKVAGGSGRGRVTKLTLNTKTGGHRNKSAHSVVRHIDYGSLPNWKQ